MKTQKDNTAKTIIKIVVGVLALLLAIPFCLGMYEGYTSHTATTGQVEQVLKASCDCEDITLDISAYGLQFNRKDDITGEKVSYTLTGCNFNNDLTKESILITEILNKEVKDFKELDVVHLSIINNADTNEIIIKNGVLQ